MLLARVPNDDTLYIGLTESDLAQLTRGEPLTASPEEMAQVGVLGGCRIILGDHASVMAKIGIAAPGGPDKAN